MVTTERPTVVIGVATKWAVDAALFFVMSAGFLLWGLIARSASVNILTFAIMATLALLFDRLRPLLPGAAALGGGHDRPPDHAVRRTWPRYTLEATGVMAAASVVEALIIVVALSAQPGFVGGWMVAYSRLAPPRSDRGTGDRTHFGHPPEHAPPAERVAHSGAGVLRDAAAGVAGEKRGQSPSGDSPQPL